QSLAALLQVHPSCPATDYLRPLKTHQLRPQPLTLPPLRRWDWFAEHVTQEHRPDRLTMRAITGDPDIRGFLHGELTTLVALERLTERRARRFQHLTHGHVQRWFEGQVHVVPAVRVRVLEPDRYHLRRIFPLQRRNEFTERVLHRYAASSLRSTRHHRQQNQREGSITATPPTPAPPRDRAAATAPRAYQCMHPGASRATPPATGQPAHAPISALRTRGGGADLASQGVPHGRVPGPGIPACQSAGYATHAPCVPAWGGRRCSRAGPPGRARVAVTRPRTSCVPPGAGTRGSSPQSRWPPKRAILACAALQVSGHWVGLNRRP